MTWEEAKQLKDSGYPFQRYPVNPEEWKGGKIDVSKEGGQVFFQGVPREDGTINNDFGQWYYLPPLCGKCGVIIQEELKKKE